MLSRCTGSQRFLSCRKWTPYFHFISILSHDLCNIGSEQQENLHSFLIKLTSLGSLRSWFIIFFFLPEIVKREDCWIGCVILWYWCIYWYYIVTACADFSCHLLASWLWLRLHSKLQHVCKALSSRQVLEERIQPEMRKLAIFSVV